VTELGQKLREAREAKGLSLDQLQEMTKIQKRYLVSIEEGNYDALPGEFYVRGFIKQYAETVGLDPEAIAQEHFGRMPVTPTQDVPLRSQQPRETVSRNASSKIMDHMPKMFIALLVIAVGVGIWLTAQLFAKPSEHQAEKVTPSSDAQVQEAKDSTLGKQQEEPKEEKAKTEKTQPAQEPVQELKAVQTSGKTTTMELRNNKGFTVEITAKGPCYIDIKNGAGKLFYSGTLNEGESHQQDMSAEEAVRLNIGSSPNADIKINGQAVAYPQDPKEFYHQILLIKNLSVSQAGQPAQQ